MTGRLYYRPREVAEMTGASLRTVRRWIRDEKLRSRLVGGVRLVLAEDVDGIPRGPLQADSDAEADRWARDFLGRV